MSADATGPDDTDGVGDVAPDDVVDDLAELVEGRDLSVATAESLTGGLLANTLARSGGSGEWFLGGVVAYASAVKHDLLDVPAGPVVSEAAARAMAANVARLLGADIGVAVTGVGGPDPQDGEPPGSVWLAVHVGTETHARHVDLDGSPEQICGRTCAEALRLAVAHLRSTTAA